MSTQNWLNNMGPDDCRCSVSWRSSLCLDPRVLEVRSEYEPMGTRRLGELRIGGPVSGELTLAINEIR